MQPLHPFAAQPDSHNAAVIDEEARREEAHPSTVSQDDAQTCQDDPSNLAMSSKTDPQDVRPDSSDSGANAAPLPMLANNDKDLSADATPTDNSTDNSRRSRIMARLDQMKGGGPAAHIRSLEDLEEIEEAMELPQQDQQSHDLSGWPQTEDEFAAHCDRLSHAMKNLDNIHDAVGGSGGSSQSSLTRSGDSIAVKLVKSKTDFEINLLAGKFMRATRKAQRGRLSVPGKKVHEYGTFTLRFQAVVDAFTVSKLLVRSAFDGDNWIDRIAINPNAELDRKQTNKAINETKGQKMKFAERMKKQDPTINFKNTTSSTTGEASTPAETPSPAAQAQAQQQPNQGAAVPSPQLEMAPDTSPASPPPKRFKVSQEEVGHFEEAGPSSAYETNVNEREQALEAPASDHGQQELQTPQDGSLDEGFTDPSIGDEVIHRSMDGGSEQMEAEYVFSGMPRAQVAPDGGRGTVGHDGQVAYAQLPRLNLDPNPLNVPGPIRQYYRSSVYEQADPGWHLQPPSGMAEYRFIRPDDDMQHQAEDRDSIYYDG